MDIVHEIEAVLLPDLAACVTQYVGTIVCVDDPQRMALAHVRTHLADPIADIVLAYADRMLGLSIPCERLEPTHPCLTLLPDGTICANMDGCYLFALSIAVHATHDTDCDIEISINAIVRAKWLFICSCVRELCFQFYMSTGDKLMLTAHTTSPNTVFLVSDVSCCAIKAS